MTPEHAIQNSIRNALAGRLLLWRVNVGQAWAGDANRLPDGGILLKHPRPFNTGLPAGFSDLFGVVPVEVTQDMVGKTLGVFVAGEVKTRDGRVSDKQAAFLRAIENSGGRAGVWRSVDDALATLGWGK